MAFAVRNLSVLAYAQGFTLWHYKGGGSTLAETAAPGFFAGSGGMVQQGDIMHVSAIDGGATYFMRDHAVTVQPMQPMREAFLLAAPVHAMAAE